MWKTPGGCVVIEPDAPGRPREDSASSRAPEGTLLPDHRATDRYWSICLFRHLVDCNYQRVVCKGLGGHWNAGFQVAAIRLEINPPQAILH